MPETPPSRTSPPHPPVALTAEWRAELLEALPPVPEGCAVRTGPLAVSDGTRSAAAVLAVWNFRVAGGSFGEADASSFCAAVDTAIELRLPLVSVTRSGGTRLPEGMQALVGMPRVVLALRRLAAAGIPHVSVLDRPTTGGVFVTVASRADVRLAVAGGVVGFAGPRVVEAVTGALPEGSHQAETAAAHGLVDALLPAEELPGALLTTLLALPTAPADPPVPAVPPGAAPTVPDRDGPAQVAWCRTVDRPGGAALLDQLLTGGTALAAADGSVAARVGRLGGGRSVVGVALAAQRSGRPTPDGFRLLTRAAGLAGRWGVPLLTLVDTPGAEPGAAAENDGLAAAIGEAMEAVLTCPSPTLAVLHGEGGSGGALAAAATDLLLVTPDAYFAALVPEGASAALRRPVDEAAALLRLTPADLLEQGVADALVSSPGIGYPAASTAADLLSRVVTGMEQLVAADPGQRLRDRWTRWSSPLSERWPTSLRDSEV